ELSSLDFLARLRLGKILDKEEKWVKFTEILLSETGQASQVVECIRVCSISEAGGGSGSPTSFLLDQLEQWPQIKISTMIRVLNEMQLQEAVDLLQH
uniref:Pentatricopeptide repeat-containing protein n=1 Tax=Romanomermis culicivorax TaxID=13658 RepID=A0A915HP72_ROMCU